MARWRAETQQDVTNFDGCGFGKCCYIWFRLSLLMPLKPSHNLLVRGANLYGNITRAKTLQDYHLVNGPNAGLHKMS